MSNYTQITIHSKHSKNYINGSVNPGRIIKGSRLGNTYSLDTKDRGRRTVEYERAPDGLNEEVVGEGRTGDGEGLQAMGEGEEKESSTKNEGFDSKHYPAICFHKTTMRNILKQFSFPPQSRALSPIDERTPLLYQIVANLFSEITFYMFNILISEDPLTHSIFVFFSDSDIIPYTKCCNKPAYIEMHPQGTGRVLCNSSKCAHPSLVEFLINYEDGQKIWDDLTYLHSAPEKDIGMRERISKSIHTGKFRCLRLKKIIDETAREVSKTFYSSKNVAQSKKHADSAFDDTFLTNANPGGRKNATTSKLVDSQLNEEQMAELTLKSDRNIESLKVKLQYILQKQRELPKKLAQGIIDQGIVFHKRFDSNEKIENYMRKTRNSHGKTQFTFPRLMDQIKYQENRRNKSYTPAEDTKKD